MSRTRAAAVLLAGVASALAVACLGPESREPRIEEEPSEEIPEAPPAPAEPEDAEPAEDVNRVRPTERGARILLEALRDNVVLGCVRAGRMLREREGAQRLELGERYARAAQQGVPPAFRPYFANWLAIELEERGGEVHLTLRFSEWLKARPVSQGQIQLHDVGLYLSHGEVVEGVLELDGLEDPRARGEPVGYARVRKAPDDVMVEPSRAIDYPGGHPWGPEGRSDAAVGVERIERFALVTTTDGFWQTTYEVNPVLHMFVYEDGRDDHDVWISYLHADEYLAAPQEVESPDEDPDYTPRRAFLPYWTREPRPSDELGLFNMSANSRSVRGRAGS